MSTPKVAVKKKKLIVQVIKNANRVSMMDLIRLMKAAR